MSFVLLGILNSQAAGGGAAVVYRLQTLGGVGTEYCYSAATDSSDNLYAFGYTENAGEGQTDFMLVKSDPSGVIQWQKVLGSTNTDQGFDVAIDSSDNIYVTGYGIALGVSNQGQVLAKYDSSGTLQWQRVLGGAFTDIGYGVTVDSSNNVYVVGYTTSTGSGGDDLLLAKYDSSGTLQWQRILGGGSNDVGWGITLDSADNIYVNGYTASTGAGGFDFLIAKYNSSGSLQWQRTIGGAGTELSYGINIDSSDNVYVIGYTSSEGAGSEDFLIAKYNSSGTLQWQKLLGGSNGEFGRDITIDSSDNVYVIGYTSSEGSGGFDILLAKYDSAGTIQWQRTLGGASNSFGYGITSDSQDNLYAVGRSLSAGEGGSDWFISVLPNDGSLTGTYVLDGANIDYAASTLTAAGGSLTSSTSSLTAATSSLTATTATMTAGTASLTEHRVDL